VFDVVDYKHLAWGMPFRVPWRYMPDSHNYVRLDHRDISMIARSAPFRIEKYTYIYKREARVKRLDIRGPIFDMQGSMLLTKCNEQCVMKNEL